MKRVSKAVFPVGGLGIRFLPATKANPMEMLPIVDKPLIQYAVEEAVAAGITDLIFVNGRNKRAIPDHFDKAYELETEIVARGRGDMLDVVRDILPPYANCIYLRQSEALGLGHALLCAEPAINDEPFVVVMADDLIDAEPGVTAQLVAAFDYYLCSLLAVQGWAVHASGLRGWLDTVPMGGGMRRINAFLGGEPGVLPASAQGMAGRFLFTPRLFHHLRRVGRDARGGIDLYAAVARLASEQQVLACEFQGVRFDCGSKLGYLQAVVEHALKRPELGAELALYVKERICADALEAGATTAAMDNGNPRPEGEG